MTVMLAPETTAVTAPDPSELLDRWPGLFVDLAGYIARHQEVTLAYAQQMLRQALIWLAATRETLGRRVGMTDAVDPAWHAFLLHSREYREFCDIFFGGYLDHVPPAPGQAMTAQEIAGTLPALRGTLYGRAVREEFWAGPGYGCCPENPGTRRRPDEPAPAMPGTGTSPAAG
ncbi:hypothetical protein [Actinomadura roseirufa]|uniref:hypothetical protein n=1 Tax=Actinomadura roseirufa TaxID=2094049 RepID=UPI00104189C2|nr:hypothetical protein [Actinomadura roseirufa]